ncbi:hypothetical protein A3C09_03805 [Candidatus Uhrbacteria bacterium RIFCSPHIGHO2_02_FULL_47_44]|uniref:Uncharacterized protein n=1 Tax=Candidatus Uhrbacteria bacterium RIFCSPLOWO2_02_FULL_48_18 TaxID=1802408 RepID=A0A1F7VDY6_9BACT|nr:MAG: hypothetical protein A2839_00715 [Candidatus Uhrbacteria bacterium RIFCSPHIGHO2_01_FULL_47_10]OGL71803.1 MAG: hypothetical protein A3C09_03805 [Candidatus Uhrbacteria bacterium RIFCSPHIGHO2_02_FULL_47_44]OGL80623.1 MAG: hypothetical protein A3B20_04480 [Candidatus Uhrbacteria bacterium RIFCSPLOWO2_01_FULL_47_17]OGL88194.1 MAG: hypothetical protein A3I41_00500 [Candidatus Uhrbacteria bacterium RIFCSPLOWO2_02_FULL_48_18]OGL92349.1 MAG: hypothetical protein A3H12_03275 [Candidatus Uhrbacte
MYWFLLGYLVLTFFLNHICAQVHHARACEHPVRKSNIVLDVVTFIAVLLRLPFYALGVVLYNACCLGTVVAAMTDVIPEHATTLWIYVLADNLGYASYAMREFLVLQFTFLSQYAKSDWSFTYYDYRLGNGKLFSFYAQPQHGHREHYVVGSLYGRIKEEEQRHE